MTGTTLTRIAGGTIIAAAVLAAIVTAAEIVTAPYNAQPVLVAWDAPAHLVKYLAMLALLVSLPAAFVVQRATAGRLGLAGLVLILFGLGAAGTPYNVLEMTLDSSQPTATLQATWEQLWNNPLLGATAGIGFLGIMIGIVMFAVASRRAGGAFRSASTASLISLGIAVVQMFAMDALPSVIPHGPTWLLLGLGAYGVAVARLADVRQTDSERSAVLAGTARA